MNAKDMSDIIKDVWRDRSGDALWPVGAQVTVEDGPGKIVSINGLGGPTYSISLDGGEKRDLWSALMGRTYEAEDIREYWPTEEEWRTHLAAERARLEAERAEEEARRLAREREARKLRNRFRRRITALRWRIVHWVRPDDEPWDY